VLDSTSTAACRCRLIIISEWKTKGGRWRFLRWRRLRKQCYRCGRVLQLPASSLSSSRHPCRPRSAALRRRERASREGRGFPSTVASSTHRSSSLRGCTATDRWRAANSCWSSLRCACSGGWVEVPATEISAASCTDMSPVPCRRDSSSATPSCNSATCASMSTTTTATTTTTMTTRDRGDRYVCMDWAQWQKLQFIYCVNSHESKTETVVFIPSFAIDHTVVSISEDRFCTGNRNMCRHLGLS